MAPGNLQLQLAEAEGRPLVPTSKGIINKGRCQPPRQQPPGLEMAERHCARGVCAARLSLHAQAVVPMLPVGRPPPPLRQLVQPLRPLLGGPRGSSGRSLLESRTLR
jgi:hypothetical protein